MFLGVDRREDIETEPLAGQRPLAFVLSAITLAGLLAMAATAHWVTGAHQVVGPIQGHISDAASPSGEPAQLGQQLYRTTSSPSKPRRPAGHRRGGRLFAGRSGRARQAEQGAWRPDRPGAGHRGLNGAWYIGLAW